MDDDSAARAFDEHRSRLRAIAYRMLGSTGEADDAVQETWLRFHRHRSDDIGDLGAYLTTVVARVSLNLLRSRSTRREEPLDVRIPDPIVGPVDGGDPEHEVLLADSLGLALAVVLETLSPAERLAFVLHDMFGVPFDQVATIVDRTPEAARKLASRARARVRAADPDADPDTDAQREVVEAFLAAARDGDFDRLLAVLDPDIVLRRDTSPDAPVDVVRGARDVAGNAVAFGSAEVVTRLVLVNGAVGTLSTRDGRPVSVGGVVVRGGRVAGLDFLLDPVRLARLDLAFLGSD